MKWLDTSGGHGHDDTTIQSTLENKEGKVKIVYKRYYR
jgi:hypothetical protein